MSILHYFPRPSTEQPGHLAADDRFTRDPLDDLKHGLDLVFELKEKIDALHPIATETLIRLLSH